MFINFSSFYVSEPASLLFLSHLFCSVGGMLGGVGTAKWEGKGEKSWDEKDFAELDVVVLFEETERDPDEGPRN